MSFFGVIIPTYERTDDLRNCIKSLLPENQIFSKPYEIIISDDSNSDSSKEMSMMNEFPKIKYVKGKKRDQQVIATQA